MRKILIPIFLIMAAAQGQTYTRPTSSASSSANVSACYGAGGYSDWGSGPLANAYTGRTGVGPVESPYAALVVGEGDYTQATATWSSILTGPVTVYMTASDPDYVSGVMYSAMSYSTNGGSTWTFVGYFESSSPATLSVTISSMSAPLEVSYCAVGPTSNPGITYPVSLYDMWASSTGVTGQDGGSFTTGMVEIPKRYSSDLGYAAAAM
jgi:hypothetical protein